MAKMVDHGVFRCPADIAVSRSVTPEVDAHLGGAKTAAGKEDWVKTPVTLLVMIHSHQAVLRVVMDLI